MGEISSTRPEPESELLLPHEAAEMLRLDPKTLTRWYHRGLIPAVVLPSGHHRFYASDIEAILRGHQVSRAPVAKPIPGQMELPGM